MLAGADGHDGDDDDTHASSTASLVGSKTPYTLVRAKNVGMTAILLFARDPAAIRSIEEAECGFGAADMGNKGAVGLRVTWQQQPHDAPTEVTFVAAHLAAMEWNLKKRNANWRAIVAGLTFANPLTVLPANLIPPATTTPDRSGAGDTTAPPTGDSPDPSEEEEEEEEDSAAEPLLPDSQSPSELTTSPAIRTLSLFKPTSHLFLAGDLNYRTSLTTPPPLAPFPSFSPSSRQYHALVFAQHDQLTQERLANRTLHGMSEAPVKFGPTYKFDVLPDWPEGTAGRPLGETEELGEVPWRFAPHRWPGWTDRVLYLDGFGGEKVVEVLAYKALPVVRSSDHRAVGFRARVGPVVVPEGVEVEGEDEDEGGVVDPRVRLPVAVDVHAWERRAAARRKELVLGWSALVWSTREGAMFLGTVLLLGVGGWWVSTAW